MTKKQKWEYRLLQIKHINAKSSRTDGEKKLNRLGKMGWEAVGIVPWGNRNKQVVFLLKRPKQA